MYKTKVIVYDKDKVGYVEEVGNLIVYKHVLYKVVRVKENHNTVELEVVVA